MKKGLLFLAVGLTVLSAVKAQSVSVSVNVRPPYSLQPRDYIQQGNNVTITLVNLGSIPTTAQVFTSIEGINNAVQIRIRPVYTAPVPLPLGPGETKTLTLNQLRAYNGNPGFNDIIFQGYDSKLYFGNGSLPEGMYRVCATVVTGGAAGGGTFSGCGILALHAYDAPIILNPLNASTVKPLQPQNLFFNWTPVGIAGRTNYIFKLVDLTETPVNNPNDAFQNNVLPFFQQRNIVINSLVYDQDKLKLKEGHKYAAQVTAYDPRAGLLFKNNGKSPVIVFWYRNTQTLSTNNNNMLMHDAPKGPCSGTTRWSGILTRTNTDGLPNGTALAIGNFIIRNTAFTRTQNGYDGVGEVLVNFLNTKIQVEFRNIKVNAYNRVYEGTVTAKGVSNTVLGNEMRKQRTGVIENIPHLDSLMTYVRTPGRAVHNLNSKSAAVNLPVHIDRHNMSIVVVGMIFEPMEAYINAVSNPGFPRTTANGHFLFTAKGIPVHPNGYGDAGAKLLLPKDISIMFPDKGNVDYSSNMNKTFADFDCEGLKHLTLNGELIIKNQQ